MKHKSGREKGPGVIYIYIYISEKNMSFQFALPDFECFPHVGITSSTKVAGFKRMLIKVGSMKGKGSSILNI